MPDGPTTTEATHQNSELIRFNGNDPIINLIKGDAPTKEAVDKLRGTFVSPQLKTLLESALNIGAEFESNFVIDKDGTIKIPRSTKPGNSSEVASNYIPPEGHRVVMRMHQHPPENRDGVKKTYPFLSTADWVSFLIPSRLLAGENAMGVIGADETTFAIATQETRKIIQEIFDRSKNPAKSSAGIDLEAMKIIAGIMKEATLNLAPSNERAARWKVNSVLARIFAVKFIAIKSGTREIVVS